MSNEPDEVNSGALATAIVLVAFSTLAIALVVTALVRNTTKEVLVGRDLTQERAIRQLRSEQLASLSAAPAFRDRATGLVGVPIDRAMAIVLADIRANPQAMSPGYKPPEEKPECEDGQVCIPCTTDEVCAEGACLAGEKCGIKVVCAEGEECPAVEGDAAGPAGESELAPEAAEKLGAVPAPPAQPKVVVPATNAPAPKSPAVAPAAPKSPAVAPAAPQSPAVAPVAPKSPAPAPVAPVAPPTPKSPPLAPPLQMAPAPSP